MASYFNWAGGMFGGQSNPDLQSVGMLTKEQLRDLFRDFSSVLDQPGEPPQLFVGAFLSVLVRFLSRMPLREFSLGPQIFVTIVLLLKGLSKVLGEIRMFSDFWT